MQRYVDVNGVRTWYDERGAGEPVVLLHGAVVDSRCFDGNLDALAGSFRLHLPERRGHGHTHDPGGPLSPQVTAEDTTHTLLIEKPRLCTDLVATFLSGPPTPTHLPIRRA